MTVITKPLSEKKADHQEQPLVTSEVLPARDVEEGGATFVGAPPAPYPNYLAPWEPPKTKHSIPNRSAVQILCLFILSLCIMSIGIVAGLYVYRQFARPSAMRYSFRGSCPIPFDERLMASGFPAGSDFQFPDEPQKLQNLFNMRKDYLKEDVEIVGDDYEKITVPDLYGTDKNRFIHDFSVNLTGIVDLTRHHCFVMPLNRSQVLPPDGLMDLVEKMWLGYYELNSDVVRETMRVVLPPIENRKNLGKYIQQQCEGYPVYQLEKIVSGVTKRSIREEPAQFVQFAGKTNLFSIINMDEVAAYEKLH